MKVSYFPGCTLKNKAKDLDTYAYRSAEALGVTLEEIQNWQCCGGVFTTANDEVATKLSSVRALKEACDKGIVTINGKVAKSSSEVNIGDLLEIQFGEKKMKFKINEIREHVLKNDAKEMYEIVE